MNKFSVIQRVFTYQNKSLTGDILMIDEQNNVFVTFNSTSKYIWNLIDKPVCFGDLIENLCNQFNIKSEQCIPEVLKLIENFEIQKMITVS